MKMITRAVLVVVLLTLAGSLAAQDLHTQIAFTRSQDEADRQAIVASTLNLSDKAAQALWPLYQ